MVKTDQSLRLFFSSQLPQPLWEPVTWLPAAWHLCKTSSCNPFPPFSNPCRDSPGVGLAAFAGLGSEDVNCSSSSAAAPEAAAVVGSSGIPTAVRPSALPTSYVVSGLGSSTLGLSLVCLGTERVLRLPLVPAGRTLELYFS